MKVVIRLMLAGSAVALAACQQLPGSSLGATFSAERELGVDRGGPGFNGALAAEYTEAARTQAFTDVDWRDSTAYLSKAKMAAAGNTPAPWNPDQLGVNGDAQSLFQQVVSTIQANASVRPEACARAQVLWDQYLESLWAGPGACISPEDALALLNEALAACAGTPAQSNFIVYFGFDQTDLTSRAINTINDAVSSYGATGSTGVSVVGHADTVGSVQYNQGLSERRARRVAGALTERGVPAGAIVIAGRSELEPAVATGDGVREPLNRRAEITLSQ